MHAHILVDHLLILANPALMTCMDPVKENVQHAVNNSHFRILNRFSCNF